MKIAVKEKNGKVAVLTVCLSALILINFFGMSNIRLELSFGVLVLPFILLEIRKTIKFKKILIVMSLGIFASIISCLYFRGQSVYMTFRVSLFLFTIFFYFFLINRKYSLETVEKSLIMLGIFGCCLYIIQFILLKFDIALFYEATKAIEGMEAGSIERERFRMVGSGFVSLIYFLGLNKLMTGRGRFVYVLCMILGFVVIVLMGFRTMLVGIVICTLLLLLTNKGKKKLTTIIVIVVIGFAVMQIPAISDKITYMQEKQTSGIVVFSNNDYIRWIQLDYFLNSHFNNRAEMFFGSGMPGYGNSSYFQYYLSLTELGIYWVDWGLIGLLWVIGVIPVVCMILYSFRAYRMKVEPQYKYVGIWFLYLLLLSVTTAEFFREGNFIVQALALYLVVKANEKHELEKVGYEICS